MTDQIKTITYKELAKVMAIKPMTAPELHSVLLQRYPTHELSTLKLSSMLGVLRSSPFAQIMYLRASRKYVLVSISNEFFHRTGKKSQSRNRPRTPRGLMEPHDLEICRFVRLFDECLLKARGENHV